MTAANPSGALYLERSKTPANLPRGKTKNRPFTGLLFALLAIFVAVPLLTIPQENLASYSADDDESAEKFKESFDADKNKDANVGELLENGEIGQREGFSYAFSRVFGIGYMNYAPKATVGADGYQRYSEGGQKEVYNCSTNPKFKGAKGGISTKGTLLYHNCDVPTLMTEFYQDLVTLALPQGIKGGTKASVALGNNSWGNSWLTPEKVDPRASGSQKYTALELYGYNFKYTSYAGEWDRIKVTTEARALSNFGFVDRLKLGVGAAFQGSITAVGSFTGSVLNDLTSGNFVKAFTCVFRCGATAGSDGAAAVANKFIDTSDTNVLATYGWYRPDFAKTVYGVTELNNDQLSVLLQANLIERLKNEYTNAKKENTPQDLAGYENYAQFPAMSPVCDGSFTRADGAQKKESSWPGASGFKVPGIGDVSGGGATGAITSKDACAAYLNNEKPASVSYTKSDASSTSAAGGTVCKAVWTPASGPKKNVTTTKRVASGESCAEWDGDRPAPLTWDLAVDYEAAESVAAWKDRTGWGDVATSYQIEIEKEINEGGRGLAPRNAERQRDLWIGTFIKLWEDKWWGEANARAIYENQDASNKDFLQNTLFGKDKDGFSELSGIFKDSKNPNSPLGRYVCNPTVGNDTKLILLYKSDGTLNDDEACPEVVRAPIQDGLFGNGYAAGQETPPSDLRREPYSFDTVIQVVASPLGLVQSAGLFVSNTSTRLSNIFLNASFSPILETLGVKGVVVEMVKGFRDSIFLPLTILAMAVAGISILINATKNRSFLKAIQDVAVLMLVFLFGVLILAKPERTIDWVDKAPAMVETAIVGSIFEVGDSSGNICSAGKVKDSQLNTGDLTGLTGAKLDFNPAAGVRTMLCENWRTFALYPYLYGQWGTSYDNLADSKRTNTNEALVGTAEVPMGGGVTERNWGLYQLSLMTAGTTTTLDPSTPTGNTDKNLYKVVDMQAHPNVAGVGAADSKNFGAWTGQDPVGRTAINLLGAAVGILGMITVIVFSFAKITISLVSTLLLLALPFMLLVGLHPTAGRSRLKSYMGRIVSLMFQRITLTFMLALLMKLITEVSNASTNIYTYCLIVSLICLFFLIQRKPILDLATRKFTNQHGNFGPNSMIDSPLRAAYAASPGNLQSGIQDRIAHTKGVSEDMVGGFLAGGIKGAQLARLMGKDPEAALRAQGVDLDNLSEDERRRAISEAQGGTRAAITANLAERKRARRGNLGIVRHGREAMEASMEYAREDVKGTIEEYANDNKVVDSSRKGDVHYDYDGRLEAFEKSLTAAERRALGRSVSTENRAEELINKDNRTNAEVEDAMEAATNRIAAGNTEKFNPDDHSASSEKKQEKHESKVERAIAAEQAAKAALAEKTGRRVQRADRAEDIIHTLADPVLDAKDKITGSPLLAKVTKGQREANQVAARAEAEKLLRESTRDALDDILDRDRNGE